MSTPIPTGQGATPEQVDQIAKNGGPAFPVPLNPGEPYLGHSPCDGMTLRDYFAAKAMQGMCSRDSYCVDGWAHSDIAVQAYQMADAMLRARGAA